MIEKVSAEHTDDGSGRCRCCSSRAQTVDPYPCAIRLAADEARRIIAGGSVPT
jgi:hypothetical protein